MWTLIFSITYSYNVFSIIFQFSSIQFNFLRHTSYYFQAQGQSDSNKKGKSLKRSCNTVIYLHPQCCIYFSVQCIKQNKKDYSLWNLTCLIHVHRVLKTIKSYSHISGFLWQLLCEISSLHSNAVQENGTQTDLIKIGVISELGRYRLTL